MKSRSMQCNQCVLRINLECYPQIGDQFTIRVRCNNRVECDIPATVATFRDACPDAERALRVTYKCVNVHPPGDFRCLIVRLPSDIGNAPLKMPSKGYNFAHNGLICFFQHNYIPTFEQ